MARSSVRLTYEDYRHFPADRRWELIDGEAHVVPSPNRRHQWIVVELVTRIRNHLAEHGGGEVYVAPFDVVLSPHDVLQPDIVFVASADLDVLTEANVWGAPTWAIEVLSPSTADRDRGMKRQRYERAGVPELWLLDPDDELLDVYTLKDRRYGEPSRFRPPDVVRSRALPSLELDLGPLLAPR